MNSKREAISNSRKKNSNIYNRDNNKKDHNYNYYSNLNSSKNSSNNFLKSDSHREIMDDKKLTKVNFQVGLNKRNAIYIVGVLSNKTLN